MFELSCSNFSLRTIYLFQTLSTVPRLILTRSLNSLILYLYLVLDYLLVRSQREIPYSNNTSKSLLSSRSKFSLSLNMLGIFSLRISLSLNKLSLYLGFFSLDLFPLVSLRTKQRDTVEAVEAEKIREIRKGQ